jgi:S-DNA-T family DNA segregation ATPase FtsK/SpoIIIE
MKPLNHVLAPTRSRRINEILGLVLLVAACLLLLALATYTPTDPSLNTVGGYATGRAAHNWIGLAGAYLSDALLQVIGIAAFLLPLALLRVGVCWMRSKPAGSPVARGLGLLMWVVFAPAAIALLPLSLHYRHTLPIAGVSGRLIGDALVTLLNFPGACLVLGLMVVLSLYLATTFTFSSARQWASERFAFVGRLRAWYANRRGAQAELDEDDDTVFESKRDREAQKALREAQRAERRTAAANSTLLGGLFGWWHRRRERNAVLHLTPQDEPMEPAAAGTLWDGMPRTNVDAPPITSLGTATAAAAPFAAALAAAAAPVSADEEEVVEQPGLTQRGISLVEPAPRAVAEEWFPELAKDRTAGRAEAPSTRVTPRRIAEAAVPTHTAAQREPVPQAVAPTRSISPMADIADQNIAFGRRADADQVAMIITPKSIRGYKLPPSSLLHASEEQAQVREEELRNEARILVEKCAEFGVNGQVTQINPGPVVTTFEFKPEAGVKYSRVTGLADDLCLAMAAESILIERMPGKSTVGIQVPNSRRETIWLRDVVECESFVQSKSKLAIALGKDINGRIVTADLASMPHVLIAGSTGSGKSVAINAMIMSVLYKSTPEQVRMILVDPKRVELGMYEGIPHLFTPIITEAKLAANALRNAVREMERRLKLLAANHVRNIDQFNKLFDSGSDYLFEDVNQEPLPYIMIIIDELADLMMLDRANVEEAITRLAQMARAVGIHLVLATQRPSVDVITGLIKANVPTRMSFRLATKTDSRTIIDSNGAESLLGRGDMLFLPPGTSRVQRVHAPYVTEKETAAVVEFWKAQGEAEYAEGFLEGPKDEKDREAGDGGEENQDELFDDAVRLVFEFGKASTSLLQRRLRIGYGRAAHLIDMMERDGLVGPADGSKPRELLKSGSYFSEVDAAMR